MCVCSVWVHSVCVCVHVLCVCMCCVCTAHVCAQTCCYNFYTEETSIDVCLVTAMASANKHPYKALSTKATIALIWHTGDNWSPMLPENDFKH